VPEWEFHDNRTNANITMQYSCASKDAVQARFAKEGVLVTFRTAAGVWYTLAARTYAPLTPGWCRVTVSKNEIVVVLAKIHPQPWTSLGELCSAQDAGLAMEAEDLETKRLQEEQAASEASPQEEAVEAPEEEESAAGPASGVPREFVHKLDFIAADSFQGSKEGYIFQMGSFGLGYYQDVGPMCKCAPQIEQGPDPQEEQEEQTNTKWDWVKEARAGGPSTAVDKKEIKPAFQRGFIEDAAKAKKAVEADEELDDFHIPGLDGDSEDDEEDGDTDRTIEAAWTPSTSLQTRKLVLELD
jgi:hypothetical protein